MRIVIIEDELLFQKELRRLLEKIDPFAEIISTMRSVSEAIKWFDKNPGPDLLFLDIQLADGNSFEIFEKIQINCPVIFTTAFNDYAIKAFELNSIDYLLKPLDEEKLKRSIDKYKSLKYKFLTEEYFLNIKNVINNFQPESTTHTSYKKRLLVYKGEELKAIDTRDIAYIFSEEKITFIITFNSLRYILNGSLDALEKQLDPMQFYRANRQYFLNIKAIKSITNNFNYKLKVEVSPPSRHPIIISREKVPLFKEWLNK